MAKETMTQPTKPKFVLKAPTRGNLGGTTWLRWAYGLTLHRGGAADVADFDRNDAALSRWFTKRHKGARSFYADGLKTGTWGTVILPNGSADGDIISGINECLTGVAHHKRSLFMDVSGGDRIMRRYADEMSLSAVCAEAGIDLLVACMVGPGEQDVRNVMELAQSGLFAPSELALICNGGLVRDGDNELAAFAAFLADDQIHPDVAALIREGARVTFMPKYPFTAQIEAGRFDFFQVSDPHCPKLPIVERVNTRSWLFGIEGRKPGMAQYQADILGGLP